MESIDEFSQFLQIDNNPGLLSIALDELLGISANPEGSALMIQSKNLLNSLLSLIPNKSEDIEKTTLLCLINLSAEEKYAKKIVREDLVEKLFDIVLNPKHKNADAACMILCNLSRIEENLNTLSNQAINRLSLILDAFTNTKFNESGSKLHYLGPLLSNLSGDLNIRRWLCDDEKSKRGVNRIASFCNYKDSYVRRGGACGTIRNICFDIERHPWLLSDDVDILTHILMPLIGGEEYDDEEMDKLPIALQYLPDDKEREDDPDIRILLLECILKLCIKREGREYLRKYGVYYVLRELHKWEKDPKALLACENVVDILIKKEEEVGVDNLEEVQVPAEYNEKFAEMDEEFIKTAIA